MALSTLLMGCSFGVPTLQELVGDAGVVAADDGSAVAKQPLTGNVQGKAFTGKVAISKTSFGSKSITIYEKDATCANTPALSDGRSVFFTPESWADGATFALSSSRTATFYSSGTNLGASKGRVEVVTIGNATTPGTLRIRATYSSDTKIEGEVPVYTCAD